MPIMVWPYPCIVFLSAVVWVVQCVQRALVGHANLLSPTPTNAWLQRRHTPRQAAELRTLLHSFAQNGVLFACS